MRPDKLAYTAFVAFSSAILTVVAVHHLVADSSAAAPGDRTVSHEELASHDHAGSCWKAIDGMVYDVTGYIPDHPTSADVMLEWCGKDASEAWRNKRPGRAHSTAAAAMLQHYEVGRLDGAAGAGPSPATTPAAATATTRATTQPDGRLLLGLANGTWLDGRYRGNFLDQGEMQVGIQFDLVDGRIHEIQFRHLAYRGIDYRGQGEGEDGHPVLQQHRQIAERLEGRPLSDIFVLYQPQDLIDDIDGFTAATVRGNKVLSAIRDALNRGVYQWP